MLLLSGLIKTFCGDHGKSQVLWYILLVIMELIAWFQIGKILPIFMLKSFQYPN